ncbi:unnamed protein product, partial [Discosporangium mesarthrocarpum]
VEDLGLGFGPLELCASLLHGWKLPPVKLVRSEESMVFDFEVRFRTASGYEQILQCLRRLRYELLEDFPCEVFLQRPGIFGRLLSLLRSPLDPSGGDSRGFPVVEEALSAVSRLLSRLLSSVEMNADPAFQPPPQPNRLS